MIHEGIVIKNNLEFHTFTIEVKGETLTVCSGLLSAQKGAKVPKVGQKVTVSGANVHFDSFGGEFASTNRLILCEHSKVKAETFESEVLGRNTDVADLNAVKLIKKYKMGFRDVIQLYCYLEKLNDCYGCNKNIPFAEFSLLVFESVFENAFSLDANPEWDCLSNNLGRIRLSSVSGAFFSFVLIIFFKFCCLLM